jgi:hypothetical protein
MAQRDLLGDHPAEREPVDVRGLLAGGVEHRDRVVGHLAHRVRQRCGLAAADAAVVERQHPERGGKDGDRPPPRVQRHPQPHDEQDRRAPSAALVVQADGPMVGDGHRVLRALGILRVSRHPS